MNGVLDSTVKWFNQLKINNYHKKLQKDWKNKN